MKRKDPPGALPGRLSRAHDAYRAAPSIAARFPDCNGFALELQFGDPRGRLRPSPYRRVFLPTMHAFFWVPCVLNDCSDGGFDLGPAVGRMLSNPRAERASVSRCGGRRPDGEPCGIELRFSLMALP